ncbi:COX15/CtaA family protein [Patulibacter brassicae]|jgi:cytochrome c oxidase assembly protein subunit 15|uniref:COX15/CtaA family protein n=1 Tax=Patulibacter brassicae TaxID=1705717 RepID=A0ABU4VJQ0_9ACTN|nr:COX15/CtaA family protein [Patulibacter brassicae]MDX8151665.1 COX15/CtaA family protein [Patulibacter brassicae]
MATSTPNAPGDGAPARLQRLRGRFRSSPERMLLAARLALLANIGIMLTGALVRVTGSGLGCSNWPKCDTEVFPTETHSHTFIEFGNRLLTIGVTATALFAIFCALTRVPWRKDLLVLSCWLLVGIFAQGVIGGLSVLYDLDWIWISAHYLVSIVLLLVPAALLVWRAGHDTAAPRDHQATDRLTARVVQALLPIGVLALAAGTLATAAGPNSGGEGTGDVVKRFDVHGTATLEWIVQRHGVVAGLFAVMIVAAWGVAQWRGAGRRLVLVLTLAAMLVALQGVLGLVQYGLELPGELVWVHVTLATITWVTVVWAWQVAGPGKPGASPAG